MAEAGPDRVLIADHRVNFGHGAVYLFNTNGAFLRSFENPAPAQGHGFGYGLVMIGSNHFISSASFVSGPGGTEPGAVHVFHLDGTLVRSWSNSPPSYPLLFGPVAGMSDFASGLDGWTSSPQPATHDASNGAAFVHEQTADSATNFWSAPAKFLGSKTPAYNGKLTFEQKDSQLLFPMDTEIVLRGNGLMLVYSVPRPGPDFMLYEIPLSARGWRIREPATWIEPTEAQFLGVLSDLTALEIRAELSTTKPETNTLDNVRILQPSALCETVVRFHPDPAGVRREWPANAFGFDLYSSTNLDPTNWMLVPGTPVVTNGLESLTESVEGAAKFYRVGLP